MMSDCARATRAAESRFRISAPHSRARLVTVVAVDAVSAQIVKSLDRGLWPGAGFFTAAAFDKTAPGLPLSQWLNDLAGRTQDLIAQVMRSDLVVMIAAGGTPSQTAVIIGETCRLHHVSTTVLVLGADDDLARSSALAQLRSCATMLVAATGTDCVADMLTALRA